MSNLKEIKEIRMTDLEKAQDLQTHIENDNTLYNTLCFPLLKNYQKLLDKEEFNADTAVKGLKHVTLAGAMKYFPVVTCNPTVRKLTAELMVSEFIVATSLGNRFE